MDGVRIVERPRGAAGYGSVAGPARLVGGSAALLAIAAGARTATGAAAAPARTNVRRIR